jgi:hypothetical protein
LAPAAAIVTVDADWKLLFPRFKNTCKVIGADSEVDSTAKSARRETYKWKRGRPVIVNGEVDPSIPSNTAVATFDKQGNYFPERNSEKNSGVYIKPNTKGSFWLLDQWPEKTDPNTGNVIRPAHPPQVRSISPNGMPPSDNSSSYYVIIVK